MKILFLLSYYKPEHAASSYLGENIREAFVGAGHECVVYAPVPTRGVSKKIHDEYRKRLYEEEFDGKLKIHRFKMFREGKNSLQRALRYLLCICKQVFYGCREKDVDIMIISSTPPINGLMFPFLKLFNRKSKIIYNLQDIFPDSLVNTGLTHQGSIIWKIGRVVENITYHFCDHIVVISEDFKKNIIAKGVKENKITVIRNWVDENAVVNIDRENNSLFDEYNLDRDKFYVCYSGNIGFTQNMDMLLDVAKQLQNIPKISFVLVGDGAAKPYVKERIEKEKINNIVMIPFQPYEKISEVFSLGDCGLIISKKNVGNNSVPSKTWSIMSAERPVLASFDKGYELDRVIREAECGICVPSGETEELRVGILAMYEHYTQRLKMGTNGRKYILNNLTRKIGAQKWINLIGKE